MEPIRYFKDLQPGEKFWIHYSGKQYQSEEGKERQFLKVHSTPAPHECNTVDLSRNRVMRLNDNTAVRVVLPTQISESAETKLFRLHVILDESLNFSYTTRATYSQEEIDQIRKAAEPLGWKLNQIPV